MQIHPPSIGRSELLWFQVDVTSLSTHGCQIDLATLLIYKFLCSRSSSTWQSLYRILCGHWIDGRSQTARWGSLTDRKLSTSCESLLCAETPGISVWQQERPACMWVTNPDTGFTMPPRRNQYHKLHCKSRQSFSHSKFYIQVSQSCACCPLAEQYLVQGMKKQISTWKKIAENSPTWMFPCLAAFHSFSDFGCSSSTSGLFSVYSTCPRLLVDLLIVLDQDSSENLLATKTMI